MSECVRPVRRSVPDWLPVLAGETPWFGGWLLPVMPGVYRRHMRGFLRSFYSYFDGGFWMPDRYTVVGAAAMASHSFGSGYQTLPWCGLVAPPPQGYGPEGDRLSSGVQAAASTLADKLGEVAPC